MIYAFFELASRVPNVRLHIMGGVDDEDYAQECYALVKQLRLDNLIFTGRVDVVQYMQKLDFTILTSISEGQPLSVLESMAARRPCVTTEVGCCRELLCAAHVPAGSGRCHGADVCQPCPSGRNGAHRSAARRPIFSSRTNVRQLSEDVPGNCRAFSFGVTNGRNRI